MCIKNEDPVLVWRKRMKEKKRKKRKKKKQEMKSKNKSKYTLLRKLECRVQQQPNTSFSRNEFLFYQNGQAKHSVDFASP